MPCRSSVVVNRLVIDLLRLASERLAEVDFVRHFAVRSLNPSRSSTVRIGFVLLVIWLLPCGQSSERRSCLSRNFLSQEIAELAVHQPDASSSDSKANGRPSIAATGTIVDNGHARDGWNAMSPSRSFVIEDF